MFSHGVHRVDRRAAGHQQTVQRLDVFECNVRIERLLNQRRTAARKQENHQRALVAGGQQIEDGAASRKAIFVRHWMPAEEGPETRKRAWRARDRKSTRLNSSHGYISYAVFCL